VRSEKRVHIFGGADIPTIVPNSEGSVQNILTCMLEILCSSPDRRTKYVVANFGISQCNRLL